jgi:hypothetical protein
MQISQEAKLGLALGLVALLGTAAGLAGAGVQMIAPTYIWAAWGLIAVGAILFLLAIGGGIALICHHFGKQRMIVWIGIFVLLVITGVSVVAYLWMTRSRDPLAGVYAAINNGHQPSAMLKLFETDMTSNGYIKKLSYKINGTIDGDFSIGFNVYGDIVSDSFFISIYIPGIPHAFDLCQTMADGYKIYLTDAENLGIAVPFPGDSRVILSKDMRFTQLIYLYHESFFSDQQVRDLWELYKSRGLRLVLRGPPYLQYREEGGKPL